MALVVRLFPAFMLGYYIIESTSTRDFIAAMRKWNVTDKFIIPVAVVFRFLPTIREESNSIKKAMKMRGIQLTNGHCLRKPWIYIEYRIIPLMISIAKIGEELSAAALTRGLQVGIERSSIAEIKFCVFDYLLGIVSLGICIFGVIRGMAL
jgi:energy-coupling factor transport system permease protein